MTTFETDREMDQKQWNLRGILIGDFLSRMLKYVPFIGMTW